MRGCPKKLFARWGKREFPYTGRQNLIFLGYTLLGKPAAPPSRQYFYGVIGPLDRLIRMLFSPKDQWLEY